MQPVRGPVLALALLIALPNALALMPSGIERAPDALGLAQAELAAIAPRDAAMAERLALQHAQLHVVGALRGLGPSDAAQAVRWLADEVSPSPLPAEQEPPSIIAARIGALHGAPMGADLAVLDALPGAPRGALAHVLDAFLDYATASGPAARAAARGSLVEAGLDLGDVAFPPLRLTLPRALVLELEGTSDVYVQDVALIIDFGGDDRYLNNAGGSNLAGGACGAPTGAAAVFDFGGNDRYGDGTRGCGVNGGGVAGAGLLVDGAGDDVYLAASRGVNGGGAELGSGMLLDLGGNDRYEAGGLGSNGGASLPTEDPFANAVAPFGLHLFAGAVEGGGAAPPVFGAAGALLDFGGSDTYLASTVGANGGGMQGTGLLADFGPETDAYASGGLASNGGALFGGRGLLLDEGGDETYLADGPHDVFGGCCGVNGGGYVSGIGLLYDGGGDDSYLAGHEDARGYHAGRNGANAGTSLYGVGMLVDEGEGRDRYHGGVVGSNGGAEGTGVSVLVDGGGDDTFRGTMYAVNGGATGGGEARLLDLGGNDLYLAGLVDPFLAGYPHAMNGGANQFGGAVLHDFGGDDRYLSVGLSSNGAAEFTTLFLFNPGGALLKDDGGHDVYVDGHVSCEDCTVAPKGTAGAQVDT